MPTIEILVEERRLTGFTGAGSGWLSKQMKQSETNLQAISSNALWHLREWQHIPGSSSGYSVYCVA